MHVAETPIRRRRPSENWRKLRRRKEESVIESDLNYPGPTTYVEKCPMCKCSGRRKKNRRDGPTCSDSNPLGMAVDGSSGYRRMAADGSSGYSIPPYNACSKSSAPKLPCGTTCPRNGRELSGRTDGRTEFRRLIFAVCVSSFVEK